MASTVSVYYSIFRRLFPIIVYANNSVLDWYSVHIFVSIFSCLTAGYYVFFETTVGRQGDNAQLGSPPLTLNNIQYCLSFYYTMYGADVGKVTKLK